MVKKVRFRVPKKGGFLCTFWGPRGTHRCILA